MFPETLEYYQQPGLMTDLARHADRLQDLPDAIDDLCKLVQGVMIHVFWLGAYDVKVVPEREKEVQIRGADKLLDRIFELDDSPLTVARSNDKKVYGNCRDFTTLLVALLRHKGIPARARCGFGTFFIPGHNEDHWQAEVWQDDQKRWVLVDAQLDAVQQQKLNLTFDPSDIPPGNFITGGEAWQLCRAGRADPETFGIQDMAGLWFILGDALRDLAALNKVEVLPWDTWGLMAEVNDGISEKQAQLVDQVAATIAAGDRGFDELRALYEDDELLCVPEVVISYHKGQPLKETVAGS